jgi:DNA-directed RNA polymerase
MVHLFTRLGDLDGVKGDKQKKEQGGRGQEKKFLRWGKSPVKTYNQWKDHGDKWQLIRACLELYALHKNPNHKSTLICEIDQSTSILQHIALIEGDAKLAGQVNLTDNYNDIYSEIADGIDDLSGLEHGDKRKVVKTALLAWGYGGTAWTACQDYHNEDLPYLVAMTAGERLGLANKVVKAIETALPAAKKYRDDWKGPIDSRWEKISENKVIFPTSSGFQVHCYKQQVDKRRQEIFQDPKDVGADRNNNIKLSAYRPNNMRDKRKMSKAMAPNLVHSVDASVIHAVLADMGENESVVAVHDAVGTHLRDVDTVRKVFQMCFYRAYKYENHPLQLLKDDPFDGPDDQETLDTMGDILNQALKSKHMI